MRAWLASRAYAWMTPRRLRAVSAGLVTLGVVSASVRF